MPNADPGHKELIALINNFVLKKDNVYAFNSLGNERYYSLLNIVDAVIGNSSSGIIEAPYFNVPTINIGDRQKNRLSANTVLNCESFKNKINEALNFIETDKFKNKKNNAEEIYGSPGASKRIFEMITKSLEEGINIRKSFYQI